MTCAACDEMGNCRCYALPELALDDTQPIDLSTYPPYLAEYRQLAQEPDE